MYRLSMFYTLKLGGSVEKECGFVNHNTSHYDIYAVGFVGVSSLLTCDNDEDKSTSNKISNVHSGVLFCLRALQI